MKKILVASLTMVSCMSTYGNPIEQISAGFAGMLGENILKNSKSHDAVKRNYLESIKKGILDLERMNDPNIKQIYALVNERLKDDHLTVNDYNLIMKKINEHKRLINANNSRHKSDVANFKSSLSNSR